MKEISAEQAKYIRKNHPNIHLAGVCKQKKSKRKKYYIEETLEVEKILKRMGKGID